MERGYVEMKLCFSLETIPGTNLTLQDTDGLTGYQFLRHLFFATEGVMISTIRGISGIDTSTLQNWVKRGWVPKSNQRKYNLEQVAHILTINMLRSCMQLEHIDFIIRYINGDLEDTSDDIIRDSQLYDYICGILTEMERESSCDVKTVERIVSQVTATYVPPVPDARERLTRALNVIILTYLAAQVKEYADNLLARMDRP